MRKEFSERLKKFRLDNNLSQKELAEILDISTVTLSNYENEKFFPDMETLIKIADHFGCTTNFLTGQSQYVDSEHESIIQNNLNELNARLVKLHFDEQFFLTTILSNILDSLSLFDPQDPFRASYLTELIKTTMNTNRFVSEDKFILEKGAAAEILQAFNSLILKSYESKENDVRGVYKIYEQLEEKLKSKWEAFSKTNDLKNDPVAKMIDGHFNAST